MFCPDCGVNNSAGQKFCTRCGANLVVIDRARDIISEMTSAPPSSDISSNTILKIVAWIVTIGFIATTAGVVILMEIDQGRSPIPVMFGIGGFVSLVLICRYLLNLLKHSGVRESRQVQAPPSYVSPPRGATHRSLSEPSVPYQSIIEDPTKQFEHERRPR